MLLLWKLGLNGCYCLISFEWCVSVQRCMSLVDDSTGVCGGGVGARVVGGGVWVRVEERMAERACFLVGQSFHD